MSRAAVRVLLLIGTAGCSASRFDEHYEAGRLPEAVAAFEADDELRRDERALYRAGVVRALPGSETFEPDSARAHFLTLLALYPETDRRPEAEAWLGLLEERERLATEVRRLEEELAGARAAHGATVAQVETLRATERQLRAELARVREQLEGLKAIDLRRRGRGGGGS